MSYIILPEHSIILPGGNRHARRSARHLKSGMGGEYRFILYDVNSDGSLQIVKETDWDNNIITDNGMNIAHTDSGWAGFICIGSGSTAADVTDTAIETFLAFSTTGGAGNGVVVGQSSPNWEHSETRSRRFAAGTGTGTVREVTLGSENDGTDIFSRIVLASPIVKGAAQILDVIYRMTIWPFINDIAGTSTVNGIAYDTITRGILYGGASVDPFAQIKFQKSGSTDWKAFDGNLGAIDAFTPLGSGDNFSGTVVEDAYVADSHTVTCTASAGLDDWVIAAGIRTVMSNTPWYRFQTQYNAVSDSSRISKLASETATLRFRVSWSRS